METGMISVDRWSQGSQAYFLTHLHADHTSGLTPTWKWGPLFCSRITAKLFPIKFPGFKLSLLNILEIGNWYSLSLHSPTTGVLTTVQVMAIDANHCPGAVMYLFRGEFGCMLYTGDFRWESTSERVQVARTMLLNALNNEKLDKLYLDNTYCNPQYSFPSRNVAAGQVVNIISSHPNHDIVIGVDSLGKEDLLFYISHVLKIKIWVWPERLQIMHLLGFQDSFTTKTSLTRIRAIPRYSFNFETLQGLNAMRPTIGIMPSGLPWAAKYGKGKDNIFGSSATTDKNKSYTNANKLTCNKSSKPNGCLTGVQKYDQYTYSVAYSDHSCFSEIQEFVKLLQPSNIKGIVSSSPCYIEPLYYFGHICGINQDSRTLYQKHREGDEGFQDVQIKSAIIFNCNMAGRKRKTKPSNFVFSRVNRVRILRRAKRGTRIADTECPAYVHETLH